MKRDKRYLVSIVYVIIGVIIFGLGLAGKVDEFWSGMGSALFTIGVIQLIRFYRFNKNEAYRERIEIEESDERNHYIRNKAWAWAGYMFVIISAVAVLVFKLMGQELLCMAAAMAECLVLVLFWVSYHILKRKY